MPRGEARGLWPPRPQIGVGPFRRAFPAKHRFDRTVDQSRLKPERNREPQGSSAAVGVDHQQRGVHDMPAHGHVRDLARPPEQAVDRSIATQERETLVDDVVESLDRVQQSRIFLLVWRRRSNRRRRNTSGTPPLSVAGRGPDSWPCANCPASSAGSGLPLGGQFPELFGRVSWHDVAIFVVDLLPVVTHRFRRDGRAPV